METSPNFLFDCVEFLYKENIRVLGEMLSKIFITYVFVLAIT